VPARLLRGKTMLSTRERIGAGHLGAPAGVLFNGRMLKSDFIPSPAGVPGPLLIMMHGLGDSIEGYRWLPLGIKIPQLSYLLLNAPDSYYGGFSWYDFVENPGPGIKRSRELVFDVIEAYRQKGFDTSKMFIGGFSQGCLMTLDVGLRSPHRFAGLIGISGYVHEPAALIPELSPVAREQQLLITHGTQDTLLPIDQVRAQVAMLREAGLKIEWREFQKAHTIAGEAELDLLRTFIKARLNAGA